MVRQIEYATYSSGPPHGLAPSPTTRQLTTFRQLASPTISMISARKRMSASSSVSARHTVPAHSAENRLAATTVDLSIFIKTVYNRQRVVQQ